MAKSKSPKVLSKKHLARQERERRQTRMITGVAIGIIAIVILGIAYGLLSNTLFLRWRPAITVNGESQSLYDFQQHVIVARQQLINQYIQTTEMAQMFGMDPTTDPQMSQNLNQITSELNDSSTLGGNVINDMVGDLLIRQYAKAHGITVTAADVETAAEAALNYYPNGTPTLTLTPTLLVYSTLNPTQLALITSTPTPTFTTSPTLGPTSTLLPTATLELTSTNTPIPSLTPTATPYTIKGYQSQYQTTFKTYSAIGLDEAEFRYIFFETGLYHDRVQAKVTANVAHQEDQVWARVIMLADQTSANDVETQLAAGGDFGALAAKDSIDTNSKTNGGDLGWFGRSSTTVPIELANAAFSMKIGTISQPVKTASGYYIIQLLGHEVRTLTSDEYAAAVSTAFTAWLQQQRAASKVVINNDWTNFVPTTPTLAQAQANENSTATSFAETSQAPNGSK